VSAFTLSKKWCEKAAKTESGFIVGAGSPSKIIHYSGGIFHAKGRMLSGFPCCCYGDRAWKIRIERRQTMERDKVTCKACLAWLAKQDAFLAEKERVR
jgi:hypothetical protein